MGLKLNQVAERLEGLEETIIFKLIARAQYKLNNQIYVKGESGFQRYPGLSLFEARILEEEQMDVKFGRFTTPEERPFNTDLPKIERRFERQETEPALDDFDKVNLTPEIKDAYLGLVSFICKPGDDKNYGSSVEHDAEAIRAIAERIHYGAFFVSECKFQQDPEGYKRLIGARDKEELLKKLTRKEVEDRILGRVREKVKLYQVGINPKIRTTIDPEILVNFYKEHIIPLTKKGEIMYFFNRGMER